MKFEGWLIFLILIFVKRITINTMIAKHFCFKSFLLCGLLFLSGWIYGQSTTWENSSPETMVFELTNKEALKLIKGKFKQKHWDKVLKTPFASFTKTWEDRPSVGHFLLADVYRNEVRYQYASAIPFQVFLFKEYGMLSLQVVDSLGTIRGDAKVRVDGQVIDYEEISHTYTDDNWSQNEQHILTVELDKFRAVFNLTKHFVPLWNGRSSYSGKPDFYSYLITDKNKYKPGETVRFKSYALSRYKRALRQELSLWLRTGGQHPFKKILSVNPYHPGGFAGEFQLVDSLELKLGQRYSMQLRDARERVVATTEFVYEDYELNGNKLQLNLDSHTHYFPNKNRLNICATDVNGLPLRETVVDVTVRRQEVLKSYSELLELPDTLMAMQVELDALGKATVDIPSDLFGASNCVYNVEVVLFTSDNQRLKQRSEATFYHSCYEIRNTIQGDTLCLSLFDLGEERPMEALLDYGDKKKKKIHLPYKEPFKQSVTKYWLDLPEIGYQTGIYPSDIDPNLELIGGIENDSLCVSLSNPLQLEFSWYVYQENQLLGKGFGKELEYKQGLIDPSSVYYVEIFYFLGDEECELRRAYTSSAKHLLIESDLPEQVYPGQKVSAELNVTDVQGHPVANVDLTAFSVNSQLEYNIPSLPSYNKTPRAREQRVSYSMDEVDYLHTTTLDYSRWNSLLHLDQLLYYQFAYPSGKVFRHTVDTPDRTTQFAPYVMKNGEAVDIYVIEQNDVPCYFSWTEQLKGYSFLACCPQGKQKLTLRMADRAFVIDSIAFEPGKKTILSFDMEHVPEGIKVIWLNQKNTQEECEFTDIERKRYEQYICRLPVQENSDYTCLRRNGEEFPVSLRGLSPVYKKVLLVGPIEPAVWQYTNGVSYKHEGGFFYKFENNIVYKFKDDNLCPKTLSFSSGATILTLDDFCLTSAVIRDLLTEYKKGNIWSPTQIYISLPDKKLKFHLPRDKNFTGVANLLFRNCETGALLLPDTLINGSKTYAHFPVGVYDAILLYNDGKYLEWNNLTVKSNTYLDVNMESIALNECDSLSASWLSVSGSVGGIGVNQQKGRSMSLKRPTRRYGNMVCGYVTAPSGEPIIGVSVMIKGTQEGTITNMDGYFELNCGRGEILQFCYIGYKRQEMQAVSGMDLFVTMEEDNVVLEEVVVTGLGRQSKTSFTGSLAGVVSDGSVRSSSSVPLEEAEEMNEKEETKADMEQLYSELMQLNGIRRNFSDVAFWQPRLYTDKKGKAQFEATFPDNVTKWETVVYAMNRRLQTGTFRRSIRSYKPLMAELKTPRFFVEGDESGITGTIRNYLEKQQVKGQTLFAVGSDTLNRREVNLTEGVHETLPLRVANTDSVTVSYLFTRDDGYRDGEVYTIPVLSQGTELAQGILGILQDTKPVSIHAGENEAITVSITNNPLDIYKEATSYLTGYKYLCNEQLASKLVGLLSYRLYMQYENEQVKVDKDIKSIIRHLLRNQNKQKLWSWWGNSEDTSYWMSAHILRALKMAKDEGYTVELDVKGLEKDYIHMYPYRGMNLEDIEILHALSDWGVTINSSKVANLFNPLIRKLEQREDSLMSKNDTYVPVSFLKDKLLLWEMMQRTDSINVGDSLRHYLKKDVLGGVYCSDGRRAKYWEGDHLMNTLIAYRMVKNDSSLCYLKENMQLYILRTRQQGWNTYQASSAVATVLSDLLADSIKCTETVVSIHGKENKQISEFPYHFRLEAGDSSIIAKTGNNLLLYSAYSKKRVLDAHESDAFKIESVLSSDTLTAGIPVILTVTLQVKREDAQYVLIDVPIPAGCSYDSKPVYTSGCEVYREYFKEKTVIFSERLPIGTYRFNIPLLPRYTGKYTLNPTKVELMYFPVVNANNSKKEIRIMERDMKSLNLKMSR